MAGTIRVKTVDKITWNVPPRIVIVVNTRLENIYSFDHMVRLRPRIPNYATIDIFVLIDEASKKCRFIIKNARSEGKGTS